MRLSADFLSGLAVILAEAIWRLPGIKPHMLCYPVKGAYIVGCVLKRKYSGQAVEILSCTETGDGGYYPLAFFRYP